MLSLDDPRWPELQHAYGGAADIPALLKQLADIPSSENDKEPWFSIWSALAHQGDVYSASFAAVPHVIAALASAPLRADFTYFQFPAWVEVCRAKKSVAVPGDIAPAYFESLSRLPALVVESSPPSACSKEFRMFGATRRQAPTHSFRSSARNRSAGGEGSTGSGQGRRPMWPSKGNLLLQRTLCR